MPRGNDADVVIVAVAARGLAAAARRAGLRALVLDLFADEDTRELAVEAVALRRLPGFAIDPHDLLAQLARHAAPGLPLVLGTGFEAAPGLVERLGARFRLLGNGRRTLLALKEPRMMDRLLGDLGIPHPRLFDRAPEGVAVLEKRVGGAGGGHVSRADRARGEGWYLQEHVEGRTVSALFLGNGREARLLAFSEQWCAPTRGAPFRYGGAAGPIRLDVGVEIEIAVALDAIVAAAGLVGLASADLIVSDEAWHLIEINPRPGATLDIFDHAPLPPLLKLHIAACEGHLPERATLDPAEMPDEAEAVRAAAVFYAPAAVAIPCAPLPGWVADRPPAGALIGEGEPLCTVFAHGRDAAQARALIDTRTDHLWRDLNRPAATRRSN
ncbi:ATP-grasp domain-containing protein [Ancylobacter amanitiformis]|uniref:ATP-grasp superfamily ATP-dependent carboligase n=1 Tax=Ancylobacter amanitiformis TaxID=217069 RepID=A0ABU0LM61_9HYPH|nr:ATP-grasp domain-containing protein [Ancylobacter amanitiformis]MDQ0509784.1 putative ATP-grasp superfamily ATP-dependent carboligase [Ancylobacter amanitiformis]